MSDSMASLARRCAPRAHLAVLVAGLVLAAAAPAAACSPLPPRQGGVVAPQLSKDRAGAAVAAWQRYDLATYSFEPRAVTRSSGGGWTRAHDLPATAAQASDLQIASDGSGGELAVWSSGTSVQGAARPAGGRFGAPQTLSAPGATGYSPRLAADADGNALVVWAGSTIAPGAGATVVHAASRPAGGGWGPPQALSPPTNPPGELSLAIGRGGRALVAWTLSSGPGPVVQAATRPAADAPFGAAATLSAPDAEDPAAAISPAGQAIVLWSARTLEGAAPRQSLRVAVRAAELLRDGSWSAPVELSAPDGPTPYSPFICGIPPDTGPRVAMDGAGGAVAVWLRRLPDGSVAVQGSLHPAGGGWGPAADLAPPGQNPYDLRLAVDPAGDALAVWVDSGVLLAARRPAGAGFGPVGQVASEPSVGAPRLAVDGLGRALAIWVQHGAPGHRDRVRSASRPATGGWDQPTDLSAIAEPAPLALSPLRVGGRPRSIVSFRLSAAARVRVTVQRGGTGAALRSLTIAAPDGLNRVRIPRSAALRPGRYVIRMRATDAGGAVARRAVRLTV
jgi:hypothetical protein